MPKPCDVVDCPEAATHILSYYHVRMYSARSTRKIPVCIGHGAGIMLQRESSPAMQAATSMSLDMIGE